MPSSEMTEEFKSEIKKMIELYESNGIVTRNDIEDLNNRPASKKLFDILEEHGYSDAAIEEAHLPGYIDYSNVIYDSERYSSEEAKEYMVKYVLCE